MYRFILLLIVSSIVAVSSGCRSTPPADGGQPRSSNQTETRDLENARRDLEVAKVELAERVVLARMTMLTRLVQSLEGPSPISIEEFLFQLDRILEHGRERTVAERSTDSTNTPQEEKNLTHVQEPEQPKASQDKRRN